MTRQQRIVLSSVLLMLCPLAGLAECRSELSPLPGGPSIAEAKLAAHLPNAPAEHVTIIPSRPTERSSLAQRPVMLMAGVGIALGLLIRTVKVRIN
jgi:hypothetical protein